MSRTEAQIAADRARYEDHQRKGLGAAPRALPSPSPRPAPPIAEEAVIHRETIPGGWYFATALKRGEVLRIALVEAPATLSLVAWSAADPSERLNLPDTIKVQWTTALRKGRVLFSDMGRVLFSIVEDSTGGAHDPLTAGSTAASVAEGARNTRDNFCLVAGKLGLTRRDIPAALHLFAPVEVGEDGGFTWNEARRQAGDYVELRAEMDLLVALSNCPHPLDPARETGAPAVSVVRFRAPEPAADDLCRTATPEAVRGFQNNAMALA